MKALAISILILLLATSSFATEITEEAVSSFMVNWFQAQNKGTFKKYAAMYSANFIGIRRSGTKVQTFDHDSWLKDRKRTFSKPLIVSGGILKIQLSGKTALVKFKQTWTSSTYSDEGDKLLKLAIENGEIKIIREEMLFSRVLSIIDVEDSEISTVTTGTTPDGSGKYTSFKQRDCWHITGYFAKHFSFAEHSQECPGLKEWRLFSAADSERSWLEIAKGKRLWSTQTEVNGSDRENSFGQTQDLGALARVEWRMNADDTPRALLFQVQATDSESTLTSLKLLYRFYVIGLSQGVPQFCGAFKTKAEARKVADDCLTCNDLHEQTNSKSLEKGESKNIQEKTHPSAVHLSDKGRILGTVKGAAETTDLAGIETKYSSIKFSDCWYPKGFDEYTHECPAPSGWRLFHVADEERSWLEIAKRQRLWSTQNEVNGSGNNSFGEMQDLGDFSRMEWRVRPDGTPLSLIFKVQAMEPLVMRPGTSTKDTVKLLFRFYAIDLSTEVPQFCGSFKTLALAREKVIEPAGCQDLEEGRIVK